MGPLHNEQAQALRKAMFDAQKAMHEAFSSYTRALELTVDTERNVDGVQALKHEGHAYARSVTRYSNAAMAWLTYAHNQLRSR